ncbi:serine/threonine-protein kinase [Actinomadura sp. NPDC049753]|uniref:serine/threonine-protein kinase n=1 Tax=Actinomadura sp. NPDC049753 TaxID=3154739 RepID=UPI003423F58D
MRDGLELAGRYRLEAPLGKGGMGEVWRGVDLRLRRPVAVKILTLGGDVDGAGVARFRREAEIAATLNHPGITTVFDVDEHTDGGLRLLFLVMELMRGRDLASVLRDRPGGLPVAQVMDWAVQILDALAAAHRRGVVHRDIKPANLFLTDTGQVKVCDFGIARLADATKITVTGSSAGTPVYMAPEQIEGRPVDDRTDLYAFGCVLYQLLTGTAWVDTDSSAGAILYQHLNKVPAPPRSVRPDIDDHLSALVLDLLAKQPDARPRDAATVAERLRGLAPRPSSGPGPAAPQQVRPEQRGGYPWPPQPQMTDGPTVATEHGGGTAVTAIAAVALALLCVPGLLLMIVHSALDLRPPDSPDAVLFYVDLAAGFAEPVALVAGAWLLSRHRSGGRWTIAMTAGLVAQRMCARESGYGWGPLVVVFILATAALIMAALPSTGRWCLRSTPHSTREAHAQPGANR